MTCPVGADEPFFCRAVLERRYPTAAYIFSCTTTIYELPPPEEEENM
jgi:hypothetical protein